MQAGNIPRIEQIKFELINDSELPFKPNNSISLVINPHQGSLTSQTNVNIFGVNGSEKKTINCFCTNKNHTLKDTIKSSNSNPKLLWIDLENMPLSCISSLVYFWKESIPSEYHVALGFKVPAKIASLNSNCFFELWRPNDPNLTLNEMPENSIWLPSISIDKSILKCEKGKLNPYDIFPLVEFTNGSNLIGDQEIIEKIDFIEQSRIRTRNFIYMDVTRSDNIFYNLSLTLKAFLEPGYSVFDPVLTPGGLPPSFLAQLFSGIVNDGMLFMYKDYIPFSNTLDYKGSIILRK